MDPRWRPGGQRRLVLVLQGYEQTMADLSNCSTGCPSFLHRQRHPGPAWSHCAHFTEEEAAASVEPGMIVETGSPDLSNLDVIEAGDGAGRGAMQVHRPAPTPTTPAREASH